jgi:hypothetical protein
MGWKEKEGKTMRERETEKGEMGIQKERQRRKYKEMKQEMQRERQK